MRGRQRPASPGGREAGGRVSPVGREAGAGEAGAGTGASYAAGRRGFTLVEALVALVLSSVLLMLVSGTFLAQNRHQARQALTAGVHDDVRAATELVARELRRTVEDGILVAGPRTLRVRAPAVVATVCARSNFVLLFWASIHVHSEEGRAGIRPSEVSGVSLRSGSGWDHEPLSWSDVDASSSGAAARCAAEGADVAGGSDQFHTLNGLRLWWEFGRSPDVGEPVLLYRETTFTIRPSDLEPGALALFRRVGDGTAMEFASGLDASARFAYRRGGTVYHDTVSASDLDEIDAVRLVLDARTGGPSGLDGEVSFGWATNVALPAEP